MKRECNGKHAPSITGRSRKGQTTPVRSAKMDQGKRGEVAETVGGGVISSYHHFMLPLTAIILAVLILKGMNFHQRTKHKQVIKDVTISQK